MLRSSLFCFCIFSFLDALLAFYGSCSWNEFSEKYIRYVYDITVGYPKGVVCEEIDILKKGLFPSEIHFHIKKYNIEDLPADDEEEISNWLCNLWRDKEHCLDQFYSKNKMFTPSGDQYVWPVRLILY